MSIQQEAESIVARLIQPGTCSLEVFIAALRAEHDKILPLDPEPWTWEGLLVWNTYNWPNMHVRRAIGPQSDSVFGYSEILPREGYRQDKAAYAHTILPDEETT